MADTKPTRPVNEELAKVRGNGTLVGGAFVELLHTDDSVLLSRGRDYRLYRETLRDDQCATSFSDRRLAVLSKEWEVDAASESALDVAAAEFIREELQRLEWDRITDGMLYARWYGHAVAECLFYPEGDKVRLRDIRVRDRSRFAYSNDGGVWLLNSQSLQWDRMPERKFWTISTGADHDDAPYGLGLAHYCYWPVFFKRNGLKFWLVFVEKFGSPTAVGKIPGGKWDDEDLKDAVLDALQSFASESAIVVPEETTVELLEAARSGAGTYDELYDRMDSALAKIIVGQTASSQGTPGRLGNDDLQGQVRDDLVKADADLVCGSFNRQVVAWLTEWNFPGAQPPRVWRKVEPEEDLKSVAETDSAIAALGFEPDEAYIQERYGSHWQKKAVQALPGAIDPETGLPLGPQQRIQAVAREAAAEFAELGAIATLRAGKRADQDAMKAAALHLASRYQATLGARVEELLSFAEETGDFATFQARLLELAEAAPPRAMVDTVHRASVFSRLLGLMKGQRA
jgi:phage gp29-like protein